MANLTGTPNDDTIVGANGANDMLNGAAGSDRLFGYGDTKGGIGLPEPAVDPDGGSATDNDTLTGGVGADTLFAGGGKDKLDGGTGADSMDGGNQDDIYIVDDIGDVAAETKADAAGGIDLVQSLVNHSLGFGIENLTLTGAAAIAGTGNELANLITGNTGANTLSGGGGSDTLAGGQGDDLLTDNLDDTSDRLDGGTGADSMNGGDADDVYVVDNVKDAVIGEIDDAEGGLHDRIESSVSYGLIDAVEDLTLTGAGAINGTGNDDSNILIGNGGANKLSGLGGLDSLAGNGGNDTLDGGTGADTMAGGAGNDSYVVDDAGDTVNEDDKGGTDTVLSSVTFNLSDAGFTEKLTLTGTDDIDGVGNALNNQITGNDKNNQLNGSGGNDTLVGKGGDDIYFISTGDVVTEADKGGTDGVSWAGAGNYTLGGFVENLLLESTAGTVSGFGNALKNELTGNEFANTLDGKAGADTMIGGKGDDIYVTDSPSDLITEAADGGTDEVRASFAVAAIDNVENYTFTGAASVAFIGQIDLANSIKGTAANDILSGEPINFDPGANDTLDGGAGADTLAGQNGDDTYVVDNAKDMVTEGFGDGKDTVRSFIAYSLVANNATVIGDLENLQLMGAAAINGTGNDLANVITGNDAANKLLGGGGGDSLAGNGGNDTLDGGTGADTMAGGAGNDTYVVDDSDDTVSEADKAGTDTVLSSVAFSLLAAGAVENLTLTGKDDISGLGNGLKNMLIGNSGNNALDGGGDGGDTMVGGAGDDSYGVDAGDIVTESIAGAAGGTDTVTWYGAGAYVLGTNVENLVVAEGFGGTNGTGNALANRLAGNSAANILDGKAGADTMIGGKGDDIYVMDSLADQIAEDADGGTDEVRTAVALLGVIADVENYSFTGAAPVNFTGQFDVANRIKGTAGNDSLLGEAIDDAISGASDTLDGGAGADSLIGGLGDDTYVVDNVKDVVNELADSFFGGGKDTVQSFIAYSLVADGKTVIGDLEALQLMGAAAINGTGNDFANVIGGNDAANKLGGGGADDSLSGNGGNDTLDGGTGADTMAGGSGNDTYVVDDAGDTISEADKGGTDTVQSSVFFDLSTTPFVENLTLTGSDGIGMVGNDLNNVITGNGGGNFLEGDAGNDTMIGGAGDDSYIASIGDVVTESLAGTAGGVDTVFWEGAKDYTLGANVENLVLVSDAGAVKGTGNTLGNRLLGNEFANTLDGLGGNDSLVGGQGDDTLTVSSGNDVVQYTSKLDGHDVVIGFDGNAAGGQDLLDLDDLFDSLGVDFGDRDELIDIDDQGASVVVSVDADLNGTFELTVATLQTADDITIGQDIIFA